MRKLLSKLWEDDGGFIISLELLFIAVILVIGLIAGFGNLRMALITTYSALANAVLGLDPGYDISQVSGNSAGSDGTQVTMGYQLFYDGKNGGSGGFSIVPINTVNMQPNSAGSLQAYYGIPYEYVP